MSVESNGRTYTVSVSYGAKVPIPGVEYSSQDAHISYSVTDDIPTGITNDDLVRILLDQEKRLESGVKLAVFSALNVGFEDRDGSLQPVVTTQTIPVAAPGVPSAAAPAPVVQGGGGGQQFAQPKVDQSTIPQINLTISGVAESYFDQRALKANGTYKPGAADFRSVAKDPSTGRQKSLWLYDKGGAPNMGVIEAAKAAGLQV